MDELKILVEREAKCRATLRENRVVTRKCEYAGSLTRHIYTFDLDGHASAKLAYAWQKESTVGTGEPDYIIVLGTPPITSPESALDIFQARIRRQLFDSL